MQILAATKNESSKNLNPDFLIFRGVRRIYWEKIDRH